MTAQRLASQSIGKFSIRLLILTGVYFLLLTACVQQGPAPDGPSHLIVFAAASLAGPFEKLGEEFARTHPQMSVDFNFSGSQALARQIEQGAMADVLASADEQQMQTLVASGQVLPVSPLRLASNHLVVVFPASNPAGLQRLNDLAKPGLRLVLAAETVPVGRYTLDFLAKTALDPEYGEAFRMAVLENVVSYEDNVKAVLSKVRLGEADAGIVYSSDLGDQMAEDSVVGMEIPPALNVRATYWIAPLKNSSHLDIAQEFIQFVLSPRGQAILQDFGFGQATP